MAGSILSADSPLLVVQQVLSTTAAMLVAVLKAVSGSVIGGRAMMREIQ
jgi:hypothetical protein